MENIKRKIRLFFVSYGNLFLYVIGIFLLIILVIQGLNNIVKEQKIRDEINLTEEEKTEIQKQKEQDTEEKEYISKFINCCNTNKIEEAYNMLSDKCKQEKYNTIEEFENKYINNVFNIYICDYEIMKQDDTYIVKLTQDIIATGKVNSIKEEVYLIEKISNPKIYIM